MVLLRIVQRNRGINAEIQNSSISLEGKERCAMLIIVLLILLSLAGTCPAGASVQGGRESADNATPMMKGVELYSWKTSKRSMWRFSMLMGTNRKKSYKEVTNPAIQILGTEDLKKALSKMAKGEQILWINRIGDETPYGCAPLYFPPDETVKEISDYCMSLGIKLHVAASRSHYPRE
jgi:hypothetical protein